MSAFLGCCYSRSRDVGLIATIVIIASMIAVAMVFVAVRDCRSDNCARGANRRSHHGAADANRRADHRAGRTDRRPSQARGQRDEQQQTRKSSKHEERPHWFPRGEVMRRSRLSGK